MSAGVEDQVSPAFLCANPRQEVLFVCQQVKSGIEPSVLLLDQQPYLTLIVEIFRQQEIAVNLAFDRPLIADGFVKQVVSTVSLLQQSRRSRRDLGLHHYFSSPEIINTLPEVASWDSDSSVQRVQLLDSLQAHLLGEADSATNFSKVREIFRVEQSWQGCLQELQEQSQSASSIEGGVSVGLLDESLPTECADLWILGLQNDPWVRLGKETQDAVTNTSAIHLLASRQGLTGKLLPLAKVGREWQAADPEPRVHLVEVDEDVAPRINIQPRQKISMSAIGQFAICPYRYFARYELDLDSSDEQSPWSLSQRKLGEFAHRVLEKRLSEAYNGKVFKQTDFVEERQEFFADQKFSSLQQVQWQRVCRALEKFLVDEVAFMREHALQLLKHEMPIELKVEASFKGEAFNVTIYGRIDRLDKSQRDQSLLVIDYKTRGGRLSPKERDEIIDLIHPQLPIYLMAMKQQQREAIYGGLQYHLLSGQRGGLISERLKKEYKSVSFIKIDEETALAGFENSLKKLLTKLLEADFSPEPRKSERCGLGACDYWQLCRIDKDSACS